MPWMGFARRDKGRALMLACHMTGLTPGEVLELPDLERRFTLQAATELEKWRWQQLGQLLEQLFSG